MREVDEGGAAGVLVVVAILAITGILFVGAQLAPETAELSRFCTHHNANLDYTDGLGLKITDDGRLNVTCTGEGQTETYVLDRVDIGQESGADGDAE